MWVTETLGAICIGFLDTVAYLLLTIVYNVFAVVAKLDLFGGTDAGQTIYNNITSKIYTIISIVVVFIFAYQLLMMIIDPDGKNNASSKLIKDIFISVIGVIVAPTIFKYMSLFQNHVITEGTVQQLILGNSGSADSGSDGGNIALMLHMSFYHPAGASWNDFFYESGGLKDKDEVCVSGGKMDKDTCEMYWESLNETTVSYKNGALGISAITTNGDLYGKLDNSEGKTMEYLWIVSTLMGLAVAWVFVCYILDVGVRAVKLGVLQLISPIPIIFRIFPQTKKSFDTWIMELRNTYLELFIRLFVIFFGVEVIKMVPSLLRIIFESPGSSKVYSNSTSNGIMQFIAMAILIWSVLKFCQMAPDLFKEIFSAGGNLFKGMNLKVTPNSVKGRLEENKLGMRTFNAGAGIVGGIGAAWVQGYKRAQTEGANNAAAKVWNVAKGIGNAALSSPRGVISGAHSGFTNGNTELSWNATKRSAAGGASAYGESHKNRFWDSDFMTFVKEDHKASAEDRHNRKAGVQSHAQRELWSKLGGKALNQMKYTTGQMMNTLSGNAQTNKVADDYSKARKTLESINKNDTYSDVKSAKGKIDDINKAITAATTKAEEDYLKSKKIDLEKDHLDKLLNHNNIGNGKNQRQQGANEAIKMIKDSSMNKNDLGENIKANLRADLKHMKQLLTDEEKANLVYEIDNFDYENFLSDIKSKETMTRKDLLMMNAITKALGNGEQTLLSGANLNNVINPNSSGDSNK